MAKTAADFIAEGRALYASSKDKTQPFAHPKSWQQKATNEGFMLAFAEEADAQQAERTASACLAAETGPAMQDVRAIDTKTDEVVTLRLPKKAIETISRLPPPNSMFHAFTDAPPQIVMQHVNRLCAERVAETDARRRSRLLQSVNRIVDRWNKKATLRRMAEVRAYDKGRAV